MDALLGFLMTYANLFCLIAIGATIASYAVRRNSTGRSKRLVAIVSLCACTPLFVLYGIAAVRWPAEAMNLMLAALWGYSLWASWTLLRSTRPSKVRRN